MFALLKTFTYSIMHICVAIALAYIITGSWTLAVSIGILEPVVQTVFFYFHERVWERLRQRFPEKFKSVSA